MYADETICTTRVPNILPSHIQTFVHSTHTYTYINNILYIEAIKRFHSFCWDTKTKENACLLYNTCTRADVCCLRVVFSWELYWG